MSPFLKRSHKVLYYDAVLKPSFLYGSSVWSSTSKANLESILRLQQRAARVILNAPFTVDLFNTLNWVPFYRESRINQCALINKRLQGNTPNYFNELLVINSNMHTKNTRYCNLNLFCPRYGCATEGGRSFTVRSIRDWNSLPRSLRVLDSYSRFKTRLFKKFLVTQKKDLGF